MRGAGPDEIEERAIGTAGADGASAARTDDGARLERSWHAMLGGAPVRSSAARISVPRAVAVAPVRPPAAAPKVPGQATAYRRGLKVLSRFGYAPSRQHQFALAHRDECCYLCHAPMANVLRDLPCPHWLLTRPRQRAELASIFEIYALADVLHFLLMYLRVEPHAGMGEGMIGLCGAGRIGLRIRIEGRLFTFWMDDDDQAPPALTMVAQHYRPKRVLTIDAGVRPSDRAVLRAILDEIGDAAAPDAIP